jgi:hypothetical protein
VKRVLLLAAVALLGLAGCTSDPEPPATAASAPAWTEPADYTFVVDRQCGDGESLGKYRVTVAGKEVSAVDRIDGRTASGEEEIEVPTLGGLLELAQTAVDDGADATTAFDPADGHPVEVSVNRAEEATGGADCFKISEYAAK